MINPSNIMRRLLRDQRGVGAIETAIVVPVMTFMALGFVDLTLGFSEKLEMQQHAQTGAELIVANIQDLPSDDDIKSQLATASGLKASNFKVTRWSECGALKVVFKTKCADVSAVSAHFIKIEVEDVYKPVLGDIGPYGYIGDTTLKGDITIRVPDATKI